MQDFESRSLFQHFSIEFCDESLRLKRSRRKCFGATRQRSFLIFESVLLFGLSNVSISLGAYKRVDKAGHPCLPGVGLGTPKFSWIQLGFRRIVGRWPGLYGISGASLTGRGAQVDCSIDPNNALDLNILSGWGLVDNGLSWGYNPISKLRLPLFLILSIGKT